MPRSNSAVILTREERLQLESIARSRSMPRDLVRRARILLSSADGVAASELALRHQVSRPRVSMWRKRWRDAGLADLHAQLRRDRPHTIDDDVATAALNREPDAQTR